MTIPFDNLEAATRGLVADCKGTLAADETVTTLTRRFEQLKIPSTPESWREYRELFFTTSSSSNYISGAIKDDETIRQRGSTGEQLVEVLRNQGIIPGIKIDTGVKPLAGRNAKRSPKDWMA